MILPEFFFYKISLSLKINIQGITLLLAMSVINIRLIAHSLQFRDDNKKLHPCLLDFHSLPEPERNYNLQMSAETLK